MRAVALQAFALVLFSCGANGQAPETSVSPERTVSPIPQTPGPHTTNVPTRPSDFAATPLPSATLAATATITPTVTNIPVSAEVVNIMHLDNAQLMIVLDLKGLATGSFEAQLDGNHFAFCPRLPAQYDRITCIADPPERSAATLEVYDFGSGPAPIHVEEIVIPAPPK